MALGRADRYLTKDKIDMPMMHPRAQTRQPIGLNAHFADAMGRADHCPCGNLQPPDAAIPRGELGWLIHYECADCGATWTADWKD